MTAAESFERRLGGPTPGRWLMVLITVAIVAVAPSFVIFGGPGAKGTGPPAAALPLALAALTLQLRHEFAIAGGRRPRGAVWTILALLLLAYLPTPWFGWNWPIVSICVMASVPLVLRGPWAVAAIAAPVVGLDLYTIVISGHYAGTNNVGGEIFEVFYLTTAYLAGTAGMYGSARLVRLVEELHQTRAEVAATAVDGERLRVARDLHDLLGQSLSAIALKGDLTKRLLGRDPAAARQEVESVAELARDTLRGLRAVGRDEHAVSLGNETEGARALLSAAGIDAELDIELPDLAPALDRMLGWALREGVTNILRHSQAHRCSITGGRRGTGGCQGRSLRLRRIQPPVRCASKSERHSHPDPLRVVVARRCPEDPRQLPCRSVWGQGLYRASGVLLNVSATAAALSAILPMRSRGAPRPPSPTLV